MQSRLFGFAVLLSCLNGSAVTLEQVISREHPDLRGTGIMLTIGKDGRVYVGSHGRVLSCKPDGTDRFDGKIVYTLQAISANKDGIVGTAHAHMARSMGLWTPALQSIATLGGFPGDPSDTDYAYSTPSDVQAGASGDFYVGDPTSNLILRVTPEGKRGETFSLDGTSEKFAKRLFRFRVLEPLKRFYIFTQDGVLHALTFDGKKLWSVQTGAAFLPHYLDPWDRYGGDFDADDEGNTYVLKVNEDTIFIFDPEGKPKGSIQLKGENTKADGVSLRLWKDEFFVKHRSPTELFRVYARDTGELKRVVEADIERLKVEFSSEVWTAGQPVPVTISLTNKGKTTQPNWPVKLSRFNDAEWMELPVADGKVTPPADASGLYRLRVEGGDCRVDAVVEIRVLNSKGTVNILTPLNRVYYGRGEEIPVTVIVRGPQSDKLKLELRFGTSVIWSTNVNSSFTLSTTAIRPGKYLLTADAPGYTVAPQTLVIGPGSEARSPFHIVEYFDGPGQQCGGGWSHAPDSAATLIQRARKVGQTLFIDYGGLEAAATEALVERLKKDPLGVAPEKAALENVEQRSLGAYGAYGVEKMRMLVSWDSLAWAGGIGGYYTGTNSNPAAIYQQPIKEVSPTLVSYPAFRGWDWWQHLWMRRDLELGKAQSDEFTRLRKAILESGKWDPAFEPLSDRWVGIQPVLATKFRATLQEVAPGRHDAMSPPYRQPGVIPPLTFRDADEVDVMFQSEQIPMPQWTAHGIDYYKRPGKPAWSHCEFYGETGTGEMLGAFMFQQIMRGADGVGWNAKQPCKNGPTLDMGVGRGLADSRSTSLGVVSATRAIATLMRQYGPWLTTLEANDSVAIIASTRMVRLDDWNEGPMAAGCGIHFARLFEAYNACLYAHRPASFVWTEDLKPDTLKKFKAVLVVDQRVDFEPEWTSALAAAKNGGVKVFYDDTCRPEFVSGFEPLHVEFDGIAKELGGLGWNDDTQYYRLAEMSRRQGAKLDAALGAAVPPVAQLDNPEILLSERRNGEGRFLWAVNNDIFDWDPARMWRVSMFIANRLPQALAIRFNPGGKAVYDVFALKEVKGGAVADLREMPARLFAILPKPIESLKLNAPGKIHAGDKLAWQASFNGPKMNYPLRVRLLADDGAVVSDIFPTKPAGELVVPVNAGVSVTLEATELIGGQRAEKKITVASGTPQPTDGEWGLKKEDVRPAQELFGPHLRDIAVDGSTALINAMNWDDNFYLLDVTNGKLRSEGNVGNYHAYGPMTAKNEFFLQGFDVNTPEGYHLYRLGADGRAVRRFATYGVPSRGTHWAGINGGGFNERINNYAVAPNGLWVANAGNLGLVVWSADGRKLWSLDWWKDPGTRPPLVGQDNEGSFYLISAARQSMLLVALDDETLVTLDGNMLVAAYQATTGKQLWQLKLASSGIIQGGVASADGKTLAVFSETGGGRVFIIRDGKVANTIPVIANQIRLSPDGRFLATARGNELRWYSTDGACLWNFLGDDSSPVPPGTPPPGTFVAGTVVLNEPKISPDGKRIVFGTCTGMLYVLDNQGRKVFERDMGAMPVTAWLPGNELLVATWMGNVVRLDANGTEKWRVRLKSAGPVRDQMTADNTPTARMTWGNASETPDSLTPNLLKEVPVQIYPATDRPPFGAFHELQNPAEVLYDGRGSPPRRPWLTWGTVQIADSGWTGKWTLIFDFGKTNVHLTGITIVEDPAHPESWMRDALVQYWDPVQEVWRDGPYLLSNAATHTHHFDKPIDAAKFRIFGRDVKGWPVGNLRFGEIVFHGKAVGTP